MTIKLAFTGTGINKVHARAAQKIEGVELAAIVNHRPESMAAFAQTFDIPCQYANIEELLSAGDVDAVVVSTPNYLHAPQTIAALQAEIPVMVEKPMAMNATEAQSMLEASQKSGAPLMVAHCWRFDKEVRWLKAQSGKLGPIIRTRGTSVHANWGPGGWFTQKELAGAGAMADVGIHAVDTVRYLLGDPLPVSVYAKIGTYYGDFEVDDTAVVWINWDNGAISYIETGWWQPHADSPNAATQLYGKKGFGQVFPTRLELPDRVNEKVDVVEGGFPYPRLRESRQEMYDRQLAYFIECLQTQKTPTPGGAEGLINMKIVDAAYESARTGKVVEIQA
jgi:predicted dehydrogenase